MDKKAIIEILETMIDELDADTSIKEGKMTLEEYVDRRNALAYAINHIREEKVNELENKIQELEHLLEESRAKEGHGALEIMLDSIANAVANFSKNYASVSPDELKALIDEKYCDDEEDSDNAI